MPRTLSLLSRVGHAIARSSSSSSSNVVRVSASSSSTTQRRHSSIHAPSRTITTKTKSRGPAVPMPEGERDADSHPYIVESKQNDWPLTNQTAHTFVLQHTPKYGKLTAMECGLTGRSYTHAQIYDAILKFGGALQQLEVMKGAEAMAREQGKGPTVAILLPNSPEYPIAYYGGLVAGGTVTTLNPASTPAEVAGHLQLSDAEVLIVDAMLELVANAALNLLAKEDKRWLTVSVMTNGASQHGRPNLRDIIADPNTPFAKVVEPPLESTAIMPFSSGTTGLPKCVCHSHAGTADPLHGYHHPDYRVIKEAAGDFQEVLLGLLPFYHTYGMMVVMTSGMIHGTKTVTMPMFNPEAFLGILAKHKISVLHMVPPLLNFMAVHPAVNASLLSTIHSLICTAAPVPPTTAAILKNKAEQPLFFQEGYGLTETSGTHSMPKTTDRLGTCGTLMPHVRAKVVDIETGELLPPGQRGELCISRPDMFKGYYKNEQATRETFDEDGWFKTGDVAIYDEDGFFSIVDRIKELIKVKGLQVSPSELEDVLMSHPGVAEAGVVGVADEKAGEVPRAYVVPSSKDVNPEELSAFVASRLARHKHLAGGVRLVDSLPKNPTGKLIRRQLKEMANEE